MDDLAHALLQELIQIGFLDDGAVDAGIRALAVGADGDEIPVLLIEGVELLEGARQLHVLRRGDHGHDPADGFLDVDGRIVARVGEFTWQHYVAIEDGSRRIGDGILQIVPFRQHGKKRRDGALAVAAVARPLHQRRQFGEHRGRIPLGRRGLTHRQRDLALGLGVAGERIHQQQHVEPLIAKILGDGERRLAPLEAHQGRSIGRGRYHHGAGTPLLPQDLLDKLFYLPAPFTDEAHHHHVRHRAAGHHAKQHGFADAGAGE